MTFAEAVKLVDEACEEFGIDTKNALYGRSKVVDERFGGLPTAQMDFRLYNGTRWGLVIPIAPELPARVRVIFKDHVSKMGSDPVELLNMYYSPGYATSLEAYIP